MARKFEFLLGEGERAGNGGRAPGVRSLLDGVLRRGVTVGVVDEVGGAVNLLGGPPPGVLVPAALVAEQHGLEAVVLLEDEVHLEVELLVLGGHPVEVGLEVADHLLEPRVLLEDDLLALDPHVSRPLGGLVVLEAARPVPLVLVRLGHVGLLPPLAGDRAVVGVHVR